MKLLEYVTPEGTICPECGHECDIVPLRNEFGYSGTHCSNGADGTHYPVDWGSPVSSCCEVIMEAMQECNGGFHYPDNQGVCHMCGIRTGGM